ncbi:MAG: HAD family hydrolase [Tannerella sp.]|jgi:putative hydrolase of the HAD superfamily|nr:HAD family hydrolase [Tannerella sp.]
MKISAKGLIFDYGGTIDTNGLHWGIVILEACLRSGAPVTRAAFREAYVQVERTLGSRPVIRPEHTFRETLHIKLQMQFDALRISNPSLAVEIADSCYAFAGRTISRASAVLSALSERYPLVLVSNFYGNLQTVLDEFHLDGYFSRVIESAGAGVRKPDPALYASAIKALGLHPGEAVIIGDSYKNDIRPAEKLGCPSIWLRGKSWDGQDDAIEHPCVIKDFAALSNLLL